MTMDYRFFFDKNPTPILAHTPITRLVDIISLFITADNSALNPTFATPISNEALGIGIFIENDAVHVLRTPLFATITFTYALYPEFAGEAYCIIKNM